jgi:hypothetical protein
MIIEDSFSQRDPMWYEAKAGLPSAGSASKIVTTKGEPSKQAKDYIYQLAGEKIIGRIDESYTSFAMQQGIDREDEARGLYELISGQRVRQVALVYKDASKSVSCSPDGLLEASGLEIKCPMLKTHVKYLLDGKLPTEYIQQLQFSMWVCGFDTYDFMSYYPGIEPLIITVKRDNEFIEKLEIEMVKFLRELNRVYTELKGA